MDKKYLVLKGSKKTIEWYFDNQEKMLAKEYWDKLDGDRQEKLIRLFRYMADIGEIKNKEKFIHEGDGIYAFKTHYDRFLCFFFEGAKVIVTNAYQKASNKMPHGEKSKSLFRREDYKKRVNLGGYYE